MKRDHLELTVGLFVLIGILAVAWLALRLGAGEITGGRTYLIEARFANSGGLHVGSSVSLAGVTIGRVDELRIDPSDFSAIATLRLDQDVPLPTDTMASIKTAGLIGDKYVALLPGADGENLSAGDRITLTESAVDLESLISKMAFGEVEEESTPVADNDM